MNQTEKEIKKALLKQKRIVRQRKFEKFASSNWATSSCLTLDPKLKGYKIPKIAKISKCLVIFFICKKRNCVFGKMKHLRKYLCYNKN